MTGAGLKADLWDAFQKRFGVGWVFEGLGSTEANYGITNVDNKAGSVGRVPYPAHTNMKFVRYDVENDDHVRDADGKLVEAKVGEVGEIIAEVLGGTGVGGYFEGYTSREATEQKLLARRGEARRRLVPLGRSRPLRRGGLFLFRRSHRQHLPLEERECVDRGSGGGARGFRRAGDRQRLWREGARRPRGGRVWSRSLMPMRPTFDPQAFFEFATASLPPMRCRLRAAFAGARR